MEFREIVCDWHKEFPFLTKYTDRRLYFLCKPLIMGFRIEKDHDAWDVPRYSVIFEIIPLWAEIKNNSLPYPLLSAKTKRDGAGKRRYPQPIRFRDHKNYLQHAIDCAKEEFGSFIGDKIDVEKLVRYIYEDHIKPKYGESVQKEPLFIILIGIALYFDNSALLNYVNKLISKAPKRWYLADLLTAENYWTKYIRDREQFFARIEENCKLPKIVKLNVGEFVGIDEFEPTKSFWEKVQGVF